MRCTCFNKRNACSAIVKVWLLSAATIFTGSSASGTAAGTEVAVAVGELDETGITFAWLGADGRASWVAGCTLMPAARWADGVPGLRLHAVKPRAMPAARTKVTLSPLFLMG